MPENDKNEDLIHPVSKSISRRRLLLAFGFGAANLGMLRKLPKLFNSSSTTSTSGTSTTISSTPSTTIFTSPELPPVFDVDSVVNPDGHTFDLVISGGRVIDPESGFDAQAEIGIDGNLITHIGFGDLTGTNTIEAAGLVVSPGFIDLLSYPPNGYGDWYKVADGVTSNLCLHGIDYPMDTFLSQEESIDPPVNYGGATDQSAHRRDLGAGIEFLSKVPGVSIDDLTELADLDLRLGALGIHQQPEYTIGVTKEEMLAHGVVASKYDVPLCLHLRSGDTVNLSNQELAVAEAISVAEETGCRVHIEHLNSTGGTSRMAEAVEQINNARSSGLSITACTYPYTSWATYAGTSRFDNFEEKFGITYDDLQVVGTSSKVTAAEWPSIRSANLLTAAFAMSEEDIITALKAPWMMIGSDAILEQSHNNHPRCAGSFSRVLGHYVRETKTLSLIDALSRMTALPSQLLGECSFDMARRGRLQGGAVADITIFDEEKILDNASIENPAQESTGVPHVVVGGQIVRMNGTNDSNVRPGVSILRDLI
ncbi:MAG TPA: amidohydrolase family protein [Acidimicrobiales bacterium]|nr:amidohydrolase family protein [Acidimicrobiales bacterium]